MLRFTYMLTFLLILSCGVADYNNEDLTVSGLNSEVIVGWRDFRVVKADKSNIPEKYRELIDAVGIMLRLKSKCTVTHIGKGLAVTAGHCVNATDEEIRDRPCGFTDIKFGYIKGSRNTFTTKCEKIISAIYTDEIDYAIIKVKEAPAAKVAIRDGGHATLNTPITMFSHPMGRHLEWSKECEVLSAEGFHDIPPEFRFSYKCDSEPGSSGAAIIDSETLEIIGIHNGGDKGRNFETPSQHCRYCAAHQSQYQNHAQWPGQCLFGCFQ